MRRTQPMIPLPVHPSSQTTGTQDFRATSALGISVTALLLITPFCRQQSAAGTLSAWHLVAGHRGDTRGQCLGQCSRALLSDAHAARPRAGHHRVPVHRLPEAGDHCALWCYPAVLCFYVMLPERHAWLANAVLMGVALPQAWTVLEPAIAARGGGDAARGEHRLRDLRARHHHPAAQARSTGGD